MKKLLCIAAAVGIGLSSQVYAERLKTELIQPIEPAVITEPEKVELGKKSVVRAAEPDCQQAISTLEINHCAKVELDAAEQQLYRYLQKSLDQHRDDARLVVAIEESQRTWKDYAKAHCDAIYTQWRDGSIRGLMSITCKTKLTHERTHQLWSAYLTAMDDSPPLLPEPTK